MLNFIENVLVRENGRVWACVCVYVCAEAMSSCSNNTFKLQHLSSFVVMLNLHLLLKHACVCMCTNICMYVCMSMYLPVLAVGLASLAT